MQSPSEEERFSANVGGVTNFVQSKIEKLYKNGIQDINPLLIQLAHVYLTTLDKKYLLDTFIEHSHSHWEKIRLREESFFLENCSTIFGKLPVDKGNIDAFKMLFSKKDDKGNFVITSDDKATIWEFFASFVKISIKYIHRIREVYMEEGQDGKFRPRYRYQHFPNIKVRELAKLWGIDLPMPFSK
jgi:hypothetical protein